MQTGRPMPSLFQPGTTRAERNGIPCVNRQSISLSKRYAYVCAPNYGLAVAELTFLPLGHDSSAWVYRVRTDDAAYFLKVRVRVTNESGLLVPRYLRDHGIARVVAPLQTDTGALWATVGNYALILYPFVAGTSGMERGLSDRQWIDYGALLQQIHATALPPDLTRIM
jgi:spectinomycin phosphotransferase